LFEIRSRSHSPDSELLPVTDGLPVSQRPRKGRPKSERRKREKDSYFLTTNGSRPVNGLNGFERRSSERGRPFSEYGSRDLAKINRPIKQAHRRKSKSVERLDIQSSGTDPIYILYIVPKSIRYPSICYFTIGLTFL